MNIVFLGSPEEVVVLVKALANLPPNEHQLVGVVSQPPKRVGRKSMLMDPPVANVAKDLGVPTLQPLSAKNPEFLQSLRDLKPDLCITAAYGQILSDEFLSIPTRGTINFHPSLLPKYRGATPVQTALLNGDLKTGITVLFTVKALDAGAVISAFETDILPSETAKSLMPRLFELGAAHLSEVLDKLADPDFVGVDQNPNEVTHCSKIAKEDGFVDWRESAETIVNKFRAFDPWPGVFCKLAGKRVVLAQVEKPTTMTAAGLLPGEFVFDASTKQIEVMAADKKLRLLRLKPEGRNETDAASFWNGLKLATSKGRFDARLEG